LDGNYEAQNLRNYFSLNDATGRRRSVDIPFLSFISDEFSGTPGLLKLRPKVFPISNTKKENPR